MRDQKGWQGNRPSPPVKMGNRQLNLWRLPVRRLGTRGAGEPGGRVRAGVARLPVFHGLDAVAVRVEDPRLRVFDLRRHGVAGEGSRGWSEARAEPPVSIWKGPCAPEVREKSSRQPLDITARAALQRFLRTSGALFLLCHHSGGSVRSSVASLRSPLWGSLRLAVSLRSAHPRLPSPATPWRRSR